MNRRILTKVNYLLTCINVRVGGCILNINNNINKDYEVTITHDGTTYTYTHKNDKTK